MGERPPTTLAARSQQARSIVRCQTAVSPLHLTLLASSAAGGGENLSLALCTLDCAHAPPSAFVGLSCILYVGLRNRPALCPYLEGNCMCMLLHVALALVSPLEGTLCAVLGCCTLLPVQSSSLHVHMLEIAYL